MLHAIAGRADAERPAAKKPECTVRILNDLTGEQRKFVLPSTVEEAERNCLEVSRALLYAADLAFNEELPSESPLCEPDADLAVTVRKSADTIVVRWWACGDAEAASERLAEIMEGRTV